MAETVSPELHTPVADRVSAVPDILVALREATAPYHQRIDDALRLTTPAVTSETLRHLLRRCYGLYEPLETRLTAMARPVPVLAQLVAARRKLPLIGADLHALGDSAETIARLPRCGIGPLALTTPALFGTLYVTETATLGGHFVARHLERSLGLSRGHGYSFFQSYGGDAIGRMWRLLAAQLWAYDTPATREGVIEGAVETFRTIERWLIPKTGEDHDA